MSDFDENLIFPADLRKILIKFHENPSIGCRAGGGADMTKLVIVFRNFTNAPKNKLCKIFLSARVFFLPFGLVNAVRSDAESVSPPGFAPGLPYTIQYKLFRIRKACHRSVPDW